jgi:arginase
MGDQLEGLDIMAPHLDVRPNLRLDEQLHRMADLYRPLANRLVLTLRKGDTPVVWAGDCLASIPVLAALQRSGKDPALVWFDAHGDFHTLETTLSNHPGGMPLAMIVGRGDQTIPEAVGLTPLSEDRVVLVDARDLDPGEEEAVQGSGMAHITASTLVGRDLPSGPIHVHIDLDVVNPLEFPAHNYPVPGGPSLEQMRECMRYLRSTGRVAAASLATWHPSREGADAEARAAQQLAALLVG